MRLLILLFFTILYTSAFCQIQPAGVPIDSSNLPLVFINTGRQYIPVENSVMADAGIVYNGPGNRNSVKDAYNEYSGKVSIQSHGQFSLVFPMRSYAIELKGQDGLPQNKALFGLPASSNWVLYAPYTDKTLARNFLTYTIFREMGHWSPRCRYVELVLDSAYQGIYILEEQRNVAKGRVDIAPINSGDVSGDDLTGGYIMRIDKDKVGWQSNYKTLVSKANILFNYFTPSASDIAQPQKEYLAHYVDSFESALSNVSYYDTVNGYRHFADESSFIDYFIINELSHDVDAYRISSYFYKDRASRGGKLTAGPLGDYDLAFHNADYCDGSRNDTWAYNFNAVCKDYWYVPFWWGTFLKDTLYSGNLRCRWKALRQTTLSESHINALIDSIYQLTAEARVRHFTQWDVLGTYVWPNPKPIPADYDGETYVLKNWIHNRLEWLDAKLPNNGPCGEYHYPARPSFIVDINPNPFYGNARLNFQGLYAQVVDIRVVNTAGIIMYSGQYNVTGGGINTLTIQSAGWASGVYFFSFSNQKSGDHALKRMIKIAGY